MSSLLILDTEAIYGYVSGTPQEGAREERDAESKTQSWERKLERKSKEGIVGERRREEKREKSRKAGGKDGEKRGGRRGIGEAGKEEGMEGD